MAITEERVELIPVLDLGAYLRGEPGALEETASQLRDALERVGFYFVVGHGVDWGLVSGSSPRPPASTPYPTRSRPRCPSVATPGGYLTLGGGTSYASDIAGEVRKPNLNAAYFVHRERPPDDPWVRADTRFRGARNQWPAEADLPGFKRTVLTLLPGPGGPRPAPAAPLRRRPRSAAPPSSTTTSSRRSSRCACPTIPSSTTRSTSGAWPPTPTRGS